jgi:hypothetical protein
MNTITISPIVIHVDSELQHIDIVNNTPVVNVALAGGSSQLPTDPTFNSLTVTTDAAIGNDLTVGRYIDVVGDITTEATIYKELHHFQSTI